MDFTPVVPGRLRAHLVDRGARLVLESGTAAAGAVDLRPASRNAARLLAADGEWEVRYVERVPRHAKAHYAVSDGTGATTATVWPAGSEIRLELPAGDAEWQAPSLRKGRLWRYRVDDLLVATPSWTTIGKGRPGRLPFTVDVTPALAGRPDASLVLLLGAWLTWDRIDTPAA